MCQLPVLETPPPLNLFDSVGENCGHGTPGKENSAAFPTSASFNGTLTAVVLERSHQANGKHRRRMNKGGCSLAAVWMPRQSKTNVWKHPQSG